MKSLQIIILIIFWVLALNSSAYGSGNGNYDWMNTNINSLSSVLPRCIDAPLIGGIHQSSTSLNVENEGGWVPTGVYVTQGKMLSMLWDTSGISISPRKYRVLYRVDPRFSKPQIFIQKYDYTEKKYISDFNSYNNAILPFYQTRPEIFSSQRFDDYTNYFNFVARQTIPVQKDDVINITLDGQGAFFGADGQMQNGLGNGSSLDVIYTDSSSLNNKILYTSAARWCSDVITSSDPAFATKCNTFPNKYLSPDWTPLMGRPADTSFVSKASTIPSCPDNVNGRDNIPACYYDKGRGFVVAVGGATIKSESQKFVYSPFTSQYFLYHHSDSAADLNFTTPWPITGMYDNFAQTMLEWKGFVNNANDDTGFNGYLNSNVSTAAMNFLHFGVYAMAVEIGQGHSSLTDSDINNINVQYTIIASGTPNSSSSANVVAKNFRNDAYASGYLWLKVSGSGGKSGNINVKVANYTGSNWFSSIVYGDVVKPLRDKYNQLSQIIYFKLIGNPALQNIAKSLMAVYIIMYGLFFLAGAVQITTIDLVTRVVKIAIIVALFSETSWNFFNDNLFNVFVSGSDYLLTNIVGATSSTGNIFGFVDPIFDRYTNPNLWALLAIQLLQIHNGLVFFSIMTIYSILIYFRAILEVIISYCLAFLGIAVMISLAPFFILLVLFERTKSMFDNWMSTLFSYMIQPSILLIFFLLIDQMMAEYITGTVVKACWGILIPIKIGIDLSSMHIPISFSFTLPFLPGIPFYVPVVQGIDSAADLIGNGGTFVRIASSAFIFFIYCKLAAGLVDYVALVVQTLTNVAAATPEGKAQQAQENPIASVMSDMKKLASPVTGAVRGVGGFAKEKLFDQKITHRTKAGGGDVDYSKIKRTPEDSSAKDVILQGTDKSNQNTPPPIPSRDTDAYKKAQKDVDSFKKQNIQTPPPLPPKDTDGYKKMSDEINVKRSEIKQQQEITKTPPSLPPKDTDGYKKGDKNISEMKMKLSGLKTEPVINRLDTIKKQSLEQSNSTQEFKDRLSKEKDDILGNKVDRKTDDKLKNQELPKQENKNITPEQKKEMAEKLSKEKDDILGNKANRKTDDKLKNQGPPKQEKEFDTKKAGIGDSYKNMTPEQKKKIAEKLSSTKPGMKVKRTGDDKRKLDKKPK